jgi:universal stress protein F
MLIMFKTILVPIDMAQVAAGKINIDIAAKQAANDSARIILLNVVEEIPTWASAELPTGIVEQSRQQAQDYLQAIAKASGVDPDVIVRSGHPYKTILEVSGEEDVGLIIIASHQPGLQDYFLGSTAAKVVRHAKCSVLVMR